MDLKYGTRVRIKTVPYLSANEDYDAGSLTKKINFLTITERFLVCGAGPGSHRTIDLSSR